MSIKSSVTRKWLRLLLVIVIVCMMSYSFIQSFKSYLEDTKREQARYNLQHTVECLDRVTTMIANIGGQGLCDEDELEQSVLATCTSNMRTSPTGDMYVLDINSKKFIYDNSNDIPEEVLYFTKESVGSLFSDWNSGEKAVASMTAGSDSTVSDKVSYNYDGSDEWLEWKNWGRYIVVQGTQSDEILKGFTKIEYVYYMFMGILIMVLVLEINAVPLEGDRRGR